MKENIEGLKSNKWTPMIIGLTIPLLLLGIYINYFLNQEIENADYSTINTICNLKSELNNDCKEILIDKKVSNREYLNLHSKLNTIMETEENNEGKIIKDNLLNNK